MIYIEESSSFAVKSMHWQETPRQITPDIWSEISSFLTTGGLHNLCLTSKDLLMVTRSKLFKEIDLRFKCPDDEPSKPPPPKHHESRLATLQLLATDNRLAHSVRVLHFPGYFRLTVDECNKFYSVSRTALKMMESLRVLTFERVPPFEPNRADEIKAIDLESDFFSMLAVVNPNLRKLRCAHSYVSWNRYTPKEPYLQKLTHIHASDWSSSQCQCFSA